jgi:4-carboxymuconolactone decarboxylase
MQHGRLEWPRPDELNPDSRAVYDAIAGGPRASAAKVFQMADEDGRLEGPFNAMLTAPALGMPLQELGASIRYRTSFTDRGREIAILAVSAHHACDYEWYAHQALGAKCGLSPDELEALKLGRSAATFSSSEAVIHSTACALITRRALTDAESAAAVAALGIEAVTELTILIGYYECLQLLMGAWQPPLPAGVIDPFEGST